VSRVRIGILVATAASVAAVWLWPAGAGAASPAATGWWSKTQSVPVPGVTVPAPPNVPNEGLYVANDPSGPTAISALRYPMEPNQTGGTLTLRTASGSSPVGVNVAACVVTGTWDQAANGGWASRPSYDCSEQVVGRAVDGGLQWDLSAVFSAFNPDFLDVALVPAGAAPFQVAFEKPGDAAFAPSTTVTPAPPPQPVPTGAPAPDPAPTPPAPVVQSPSRPRAVTPPPTPAQAVAAAPQQEAQPERSSGGARTRIEPTVAAGDQNERLWATVGLVLMGLAAFALSGRLPQIAWFRSKRLATAADAPPEPPPHHGGIGRFARPRQAPPTRLV
jgi:hypothetical protein